MEANETFTNDSLQKIIDDFIEECETNKEFPLRYYYVKYQEYRPGVYGKLSNSEAKEKPYLFSVMCTQSMWSSSTYMPFLKVADDAHLSKDDNGQRLIYGENHIICTNDSFLLRKNDGEEIIETIPVPQNEKRIDTEDRILILKSFIADNNLR